MADGLQNKKVAFIIQARMKSTRLPGKILMPLPFGDKVPLIGRIIENLQKSTSNHQIIVATSDRSENDVLISVCDNYNVTCFRGSEEDVLSRFTAIIADSDFDVVVRLTADNPLLDISLLDKTLQEHVISGADYTATQGLPLGMNFEVVSAKALLSLSHQNLNSDDKEHVTLFLKRSGLYQHHYTKPCEDLYASVRVTVDYPADYLLTSALYTLSISKGIPLGIDLIAYCMDNYAWLFDTNKYNFQKGNYPSLAEELKQVKPILEELEFKKTISLLASQMPDE
jgi:spore coat polysaccharide biosynthesis protein SpsF